MVRPPIPEAERGADAVGLGDGCYHPVNLVAQRFTCNESIDKGTVYFHLPHIDELKKKLDNLSFVGLQEAYSASLCLLHIQQRGEFPEECDCKLHPEGVAMHRGDHGVQKHSLSDYSETTLKKVDELNWLDKEMFAHGKARFMREVRAAEFKYGKHLVCHDL